MRIACRSQKKRVHNTGGDSSTTLMRFNLRVGEDQIPRSSESGGLSTQPVATRDFNAQNGQQHHRSSTTLVVVLAAVFFVLILSLALCVLFVVLHQKGLFRNRWFLQKSERRRKPSRSSVCGASLRDGDQEHMNDLIFYEQLHMLIKNYLAADEEDVELYTEAIENLIMDSLEDNNRVDFDNLDLSDQRLWLRLQMLRFVDEYQDNLKYLEREEREACGVLDNNNCAFRRIKVSDVPIADEPITINAINLEMNDSTMSSMSDAGIGCPGPYSFPSIANDAFGQEIFAEDPQSTKGVQGMSKWMLHVNRPRRMSRISSQTFESSVRAIENAADSGRVQMPQFRTQVTPLRPQCISVSEVGNMEDRCELNGTIISHQTNRRHDLISGFKISSLGTSLSSPQKRRLQNGPSDVTFMDNGDFTVNHRYDEQKRSNFFNSTSETITTPSMSNSLSKKRQALRKLTNCSPSTTPYSASTTQDCVEQENDANHDLALQSSTIPLIGNSMTSLFAMDNRDPASKKRLYVKDTDGFHATSFPSFEDLRNSKNTPITDMWRNGRSLSALRDNMSFSAQSGPKSN